MNIFEISSILVSISASLMYINFRFIKLPMTIGLLMEWEQPPSPNTREKFYQTFLVLIKSNG